MVSNDLRLGDNAGSSGTYSLSGTGQLSARNERIGNDGTGMFTQTSGTNTISNYLTVGNNGTYELSGTGQLSATFEDIYGTFTHTGGTHTVIGDPVFPGFGMGLRGGGTYEISGGTLTAVTIVVGLNGSGTFTVTGNDPIIELVSYTQTDTGTLESKFDGDGISTIDVGAIASFDGIWNVVDLGGAPFGTFNILVATGGIVGGFDSVLLPDADWSWGIDNGTTLWVQHVPTLLPGDANRDGMVSADDYASVQAHFGDTGDPGIPGDANGTGTVSADDYASVQANFGNTAGLGGDVPVPEPATLSLLTLGGLTMLRRKRK